jgi:hypothetical protein
MTTDKLTRLLEDTRRQAELAKERGAVRSASYLEGKADGIAAALEAVGYRPIPWKPRPASQGWMAVEGPRAAAD